MKRLLNIVLFIIFFGRVVAFNAGDSSAYKKFVPLSLRSEIFPERVAFILSLKQNNFSNPLKSEIFKYELDTIYTQIWNQETQQPENYLRYNYDFENEGKKVNVKIYKWDFDALGWRISDAAYYSFTEHGFLANAEFQHYVGFLYRTFAKIEYLYENEKLISEIYFEKIDEEDEWIKKSRVYYEYDSLMQFTNAVVSDWEDYDELWLPKSKIEYLYFENGNLLNVKKYAYEFYEKFWIPLNKVVHQLDSSGRDAGYSVYYYGADSANLWVNEKIEIEYDAQNRKIAEIQKEYNYDEDKFIAKLKTVFNYNEPGILFQEMQFSWDENILEWKENAIKNYLSVNHFSPNDVFYFPFIEVHYPVYVFDGIVCEKIENFLVVDETKENAGIIFYKFTPKIISKRETNITAGLKVYPNPVKNILHVESYTNDTLLGMLLNSQGKIIRQFSFSNEVSLNLEKYDAGLYFLNLYKNDEQLIHQKIIKF